MTDYYSILELEKGCTDDDIRKAYKKMALKWHPDKNRGNEEEANKKFQQVAQAYSVLSDPNKRKMYDLHGIEDSSESSSFNNGHFGQSDFDGNVKFAHFKNFGNFGNAHFAHNIFESVFGTNNPFSAQDDDDFMKFHRNVHKIHNIHKQLPVIEHDLKCTLEELYFGTKKKVKIGKTQVEIDIFPGWKDGTKITFENIENNKIIFVVRQKEHKVFTRNNNDLHMTMTISCKDALVGFERSFTLIDGTTESINLKGIPSSDYKYIIKNKGMPIKKSENYGNLVINFVVKFK